MALVLILVLIGFLPSLLVQACVRSQYEHQFAKCGPFLSFVEKAWFLLGVKAEVAFA